MIEVTPTISLSEDELTERFIRSAGPGGQNVNKVSTAVELRFDVRRSPSLPNDVAIRLMKLAGRKVTQDGVLVLVAMTHRTQERNRAEALERAARMIAAPRQLPVGAILALIGAPLFLVLLRSTVSEPRVRR